MSTQKNILLCLFSFSLLFLVVACQPKIPPDALKFDVQSLKQRQIQTRIFDTSNEKMVLSACAELLQDMGFNIDETETKLGVVVGSKERSAVNAAQVVGAVLLGALSGTYVPTDKEQKMRCCIVTAPFGEKKKKTIVHVTFQRIVWNTQGQITKMEGITDPKIYQEFFAKLSKALFLEAHEI
jgi:hypothetical protein